MGKYTVSLGAGHGGFDFGTIGDRGAAEKDVTLYIQNCVEKKLDQTGAFDVIRVRPGDEYISTAERAAIIERSHSRCHVEIHIDLTPESAKSAAVWYSADITEDRPTAEKLSHRLAKALEVPDCGARVRYDYCMLFKQLGGFEDYYALIEALGAARIRHILYCECGIGDSIIRQGRLNVAAARMAKEIAGAICELFGVFRPSDLLQQSPAGFIPASYAQSVFLREGYFNLRSGPGVLYPTIRIVEGLIHTAFCEERDGWLKLATGSDEYISAAAVDMYLNPQTNLQYLNKNEYNIETTGRDGFYFVLSGIAPGSGILGAVGAATSFYAAYQNGYRRITYCDRAGYISPSAFTLYSNKKSKLK